MSAQSGNDMGSKGRCFGYFVLFFILFVILILYVLNGNYNALEAK